MTIIDCHTHNPLERDAVVSGSPPQVSRWLQEHPEGVYSVGIHPWDTAGMSADRLAAEMDALETLAADPRVMAIGETGLDSLRGAPLEVQQELMTAHIHLSERLGKPLVIHCVRQQDRILRILRTFPEAVTQPWIWHGYRGNPARAASVIAASQRQYLSFGARFNRQTPGSIPADRILLESDAPAGVLPDIPALLAGLAEAADTTPERLLDRLAATSRVIFGKNAG